MGKLTLLKAIVGTDDGDDVLDAYLSLAEAKVLNRLYPFDMPSGAVVPIRYEMTQVRIAAEMLNRRGSEGQNSHSENNISRGYETADVSEALLREITPLAGVL